MWEKLCILFVIVLLLNHEEVEGNCELLEHSQEWETALQFEAADTDFDKTKSYRIKNFKGFTFDFEYVRCEFDDKKEHMIFSVKDEFSNYVENEEKDLKETKINFECEDGSKHSKDFSFLVKQTIFFEPKISQDVPIEFDLKIPLAPQTIIPNTVITVFEKNLDTKPSFLVLNSCKEMFEFSNTEEAGKKTFSARLKTKDIIVQLDESLVCDIKVENKHSKEDHATIKLNVDVKQSIPPNPMFEYPLYTSTISKDNTIPPMDIKLKNKVFNPAIRILPEECDEYFKIDKLSNDGIKVSSNKPLPSTAFDGKNYMSVTIEATYDKAAFPGKTILIISPEDTGIREVPIFKQPLYEALYIPDPLNLEVDDIELATTERKAKFAIRSVYEKYFTFGNNKLVVHEKLPDDVFEDNDYISVTIKAKFDDIPISGETVVVIRGQKKVFVPKPEFEKTIYETKYIDENTIDVCEIKLVNINDKYEVSYKIISVYDDYLQYNGNKLEITGLPEKVFEEKGYISVTIQAIFTHQERQEAKSSGETIVVIRDPRKLAIPNPEFEHDTYDGQYKDENNIEIEDIKLKNQENDYQVSFEIISDIERYFKFGNNRLTITGLPIKEFENKEHISVTLQAKYKFKDEESFGKTVVVVKAPKKLEIPNPEFGKFLYDAKYLDANHIDIGDITLKPTDGTLNVSIEIISDFKDNFKFKGNKLTITNLPESAFEDKSYMSIRIEAKYKHEGMETIGNTIVVIEGPDRIESSVPIFENLLYEAQFVDANKITVDDIKLKYSDTGKKVEYKIIVTDIDEKYFTFGEDGKLEIVNLPESVFGDKNHISIRIRANYEGETDFGETVVLINGPKIILVPVFEKSLYKAQYVDTNTVQIGEIKLKPEWSNEEVSYEIITDLDKNWFDYDGNYLNIHGLPETVFENNFISINIQAKYEGNDENSGETTVIIIGPEKNDIPVPQFDKSTYVATYKDENNIEIENIKLQRTNGDYNATFDIVSDDFAKYFEFNDERLTAKNLPANLFEKTNYIFISIQAKYEKSSAAGQTIVIINGPKKSDITVPEFEKSYYEAQYMNENRIEIEKIKLIPVEHDKEVTFNAKSDVGDYFEFNGNTLSIHDLPESEFEDKAFVVVTIMATYKGDKNSGKTTVIIKGPKNVEISVPLFEKSLYEGQYEDENSLIIDEIKLRSPEAGQEVSFKVVTDLNEKWFKFNKDNNKLEITGLPKTVFDAKNYITVSIEATNVETRATGRTVVIIKGPNQIVPVPTAEFEQPLYESTYINPNTLEPNVIKLKSVNDKYKPEFKIISEKYEKFFQYDDKNNKLVMENLPEDVFDDKNAIWVEIQATYKGATKSGFTVVVIKSNKAIGPKDNVRYNKPVDVSQKDYPVDGQIGIYKAITIVGETIEYSIEKSDISDSFTYDKDGVLTAVGILPQKEYYQITLLARGKTSKTTDKMDLIIFVKRSTSNEEAIFENSLEVQNIIEESDPKVIVHAIAGYDFGFADGNAEDWFRFDEEGNLIVNSIDREDIRLKDMHVAQVKTKIKAAKHSKFDIRTENATFIPKFKPRTEDSCISISTIPNSNDEMYVVVTIEDKNDHRPVFLDDNPLLVGYPDSEITDYVAPPYLVKVTATDEDIGINAKIRYSVNKNFKIDPENGIIFPSEDLSSDTEFTVTATDKDGAEDGNTTPLKVKVKILKQEHISILILNNMPYNGIDTFIENLSKETGTHVRYLSNAALPKTDSDTEEKLFLKDVEDSEKIPVLRIVTYAFDKENIMPSVDFQKKLEESSLNGVVEAKEFENPDREGPSNTGLVAAVSTVSVLLVLMIVGVIGAYIFLIRPKFYGGPVTYEKHSDSNSPDLAPVEKKKESRIIDRRPTGFPVGFRPENLEDEEEEDLENVKSEEPKLITFEENDYSEVDKEPERKKSVVKFDQNVTEIEISTL